MRELVDARLGEDNVFFASDYPHEHRRAEFMKDIPEFIERQDLSDQIKERFFSATLSASTGWTEPLPARAFR